MGCADMSDTESDRGSRVTYGIPFVPAPKGLTQLKISSITFYYNLNKKINIKQKILFLFFILIKSITISIYYFYV
jgi:hypothetical protein